MKKIYVMGILTIFLLVISPIAAEDNATETPAVNGTIINELNIYDYFTESNTLNGDYENQTFIMNGDFNSYGVLEINARNTTFIGNNSNLKNTVFKINADSVMLLNLNFDLTREFEGNNGSGILILGDNITIANSMINYVVPKNINAYGIASKENSNVKIVNNTLNFEAHNEYDGLNHGLEIDYVTNVLVENNTIISSFPLRSVDYEHGGINAPLAVSITNSNYYFFNNNTVVSNVNKRPFSAYPTLDGIYVANSKNGIISNNNLSMEDFVTGLGLVNYLYGIDIHSTNNLTIISNHVTMLTTGGRLAAGTAYPIQLTGPLSDLNIVYNNLYSFSNGPNLGIYSMNFYGDTQLNISYNIINVTGLAGEHNWALVAGIEVQDTNDTIKGNIIEVHSVADVGENDNLYGISYAQNIDGTHTFDIEDNIVFSEAYYAVYTLSATDSIIKNNMLVTTRDVPDYSPGAYKQGYKEHLRNTFYNNTIVSAYAYWSKILNDIDGGENTTYDPKNVNNRSNIVNGKDIKSEDNTPPYSNNPLKPGDSTKATIPKTDSNDGGSGTNTDYTRPSAVNDYTNDGSQSSLIDYTSHSQTSSVFDDLTEMFENFFNNDKWNEYSGSSDSNNPANNNGNGGSNEDKDTFLPNNGEVSNTTSNTEGGSVITNSNNGEIESNNTSKPSLEGESSSLGKDISSESTDSDSSSDAGSSSKAYEINKNIMDNNKETNIIIPIVGAILVILLLFIGYKRKQSEEY